MVGVTAVAAQLTASARACAGIALGVLAAMFLLRAVGDTADGPAQVLSWASPLGWASKVGAYGANRFWVLGWPCCWPRGSSPWRSGCSSVATWVRALLPRVPVPAGAGGRSARPSGWSGG